MIIIDTLILLLSVPAGFIIAYMARDELSLGRKYFSILIIAGLLGGFGFYLYGQRYIAFTSVFIAIVSIISLIKSTDNKWAAKH